MFVNFVTAERFFLNTKNMIVILMGVCGSGKSTIGLELSKQLNWPFLDGDDVHPETNKKKMSNAQALGDQDRIPWLLLLHNQIVDWETEHRNGIIACSALKSSYRTILKTGVVENSNSQFVTENEDNRENVPNFLEVRSTNAELPEVVVKEGILFIHLHGSQELLEKRLNNRTEHFMHPALLQSQLSDLEKPIDENPWIEIDIDATVPEIVAEVKQICITGKK